LGTSEASLRSTLLNQGFKPLSPPLSPPPTDCVPSGRSPPLRGVFTPCPTQDRSKMLEYVWGGLLADTPSQSAGQPTIVKRSRRWTRATTWLAFDAGVVIAALFGIDYLYRHFA
jgi:hypothetical protein